MDNNNKMAVSVLFVVYVYVKSGLSLQEVGQGHDCVPIIPETCSKKLATPPHCCNADHRSRQPHPPTLSARKVTTHSLQHTDAQA